MPKAILLLFICFVFLVSGCVTSLYPVYSDDLLISNPAIEGTWIDSDGYGIVTIEYHPKIQYPEHVIESEFISGDTLSMDINQDGDTIWEIVYKDGDTIWEGDIKYAPNPINVELPKDNIILPRYKMTMTNSEDSSRIFQYWLWLFDMDGYNMMCAAPQNLYYNKGEDMEELLLSLLKPVHFFSPILIDGDSIAFQDPTSEFFEDIIKQSEIPLDYTLDPMGGLLITSSSEEIQQFLLQNAGDLITLNPKCNIGVYYRK